MTWCGMRQESSKRQSFWNLASPGEACGVLLARFGVGRAKRAAAQAARAAQGDARAADRRFWLAVLCRLYGVDLDAYFGSGRPGSGGPGSGRAVPGRAVGS